MTPPTDFYIHCQRCGKQSLVPGEFVDPGNLTNENYECAIGEELCRNLDPRLEESGKVEAVVHFEDFFSR